MRHDHIYGPTCTTPLLSLLHGNACGGLHSSERLPSRWSEKPNGGYSVVSVALQQIEVSQVYPTPCIRVCRLPGPACDLFHSDSRFPSAATVVTSFTVNLQIHSSSGALFSQYPLLCNFPSCKLLHISPWLYKPFRQTSIICTAEKEITFSYSK